MVCMIKIAILRNALKWAWIGHYGRVTHGLKIKNTVKSTGACCRRMHRRSRLVQRREGFLRLLFSDSVHIIFCHFNPSSQISFFFVGLKLVVPLATCTYPLKSCESEPFIFFPSTENFFCSVIISRYFQMPTFLLKWASHSSCSDVARQCFSSSLFWPFLRPIS